MIDLRLLGEFALARDGDELPVPTLKKARLLLARLALNPGITFPREVLWTQLWPDSELDAARFSLRQLLAGIRRVAPDLSSHLIAEDRTTLRFDHSNITIDAVEFRRLLNSSAPKALEHYRGPLLQGIEDEWLAPLRAEYEELYLGALESIADISPARDAVNWLRKATQCAPFREPLLRKLLIRLAECGDISGVQFTYRKFSDKLHRDLNVSPSEETESLFRFLLTGKASASRPPSPSHDAHGRLPVPRFELIGREEQVDQLRALVASSRLVTLLGPGGVGKTRLAIAVGEQEQQNRDGGVWFVDLSSIQNPDLLPQVVGQALGLQETGSANWTDLVKESIGAGHCLLIFDNCEHVLAASAEFIETLISNCLALKVLATSRTPLGVHGEQRFSVPTLDLPPDWIAPKSHQSAMYRSFSALQLFEQRARLASPRFELSDSNLSPVLAICAEVEGLPLAIEMAAARLGTFSLDEIGRRLEAKLSFLRSPSRSTPARHRSMGAVIRWSYDLLSDQEQALVRRLSIFADGWTLPAAEAVCAFGEVKAGNVIEAIEILTEASLVYRRNERYRFLGTVRQFAREQESASSDDFQVQSRHLEWFLNLATASQSKLRGAEQAQWFQALDDEIQNFRVALQFSLRISDSSKALQLCGALWRFWQSRGILSEGRDWCAEALAKDTNRELTSDRAKVLNGAGTLARDQSDHQAAHASHEMALSICRDLGDREGEATALIGLGIVATQKGEYEAGRTWCDESLSIRRTLGDDWGVASALNNLGIAEMYLGDNVSALLRHEEGMQISRAAGDRYALARSLTNMGKVAVLQGQLDSARGYHEESTEIRRDLGDRSGIARSLCNLGLVATYQQDFSVSLSAHTESLMIGREIGDRRCISENIQALGTLESQRGRYETAALLWGIAEALRESISSPLAPLEQDQHTREVVDAARNLGDRRFASLWTYGRSTPERLVEVGSLNSLLPITI